MPARFRQVPAKKAFNPLSQSQRQDQTQTIKRGISAALRLLTRRGRSRFELASRLREKGFSPGVIESAFDQLNEWGYLDDLQFAYQWTQDRGRIQGWGPHRLRAGLREKGIKQEWVEKAVGEWFSEKGEQEAAEELLNRRFRGLSGKALSGLREKQRVFSFLYRKGYSQDVIRQAIRAAFPPNNT